LFDFVKVAIDATSEAPAGQFATGETAVDRGAMHGQEGGGLLDRDRLHRPGRDLGGPGGTQLPQSISGTHG